MGLLPMSLERVHQTRLHHWSEASQGIQRIPGAQMCIQTGPSACACCRSQCRKGCDAGRKKRQPMLVVLPQAQQIQEQVCPDTHTARVVAIRMPRNDRHPYVFTEFSQQSKERKEEAFYLQFINEETRGAQRGDLEVLDPGFEPRTFKYLIVYHIFSLRFYVMVA